MQRRIENCNVFFLVWPKLFPASAKGRNLLMVTRGAALVNLFFIRRSRIRENLFGSLRRLLAGNLPIHTACLVLEKKKRHRRFL